MNLVLRPATAADKPRICEISSQIWEGDDYVPHIIDDWLADPNSEVIVCAVDGELVSFAHFVWLLPGYAWFEGIRSDPQRRNAGAAKAITRHFLEKVAREGARRTGLSTYVENHASIHIIESHGFARMATFAFTLIEGAAPARAHAVPSPRVVDVAPDEAVDFVSASRCIDLAQGHFPHGWKFYPWHWDPHAVLGKMRHIWGIRRDGHLAALLCAGAPLRNQGEFTIDFVDGPEEEVAELLRHALHVARDCRSIEAMVPATDAESAPALHVFRALEFESWNEFRPDVFVYEQ